jgi:hypothetical protein
MCQVTHIGAITLPYSVNTTVLLESGGTTEKGLRLTLGVDNEADLAWLNDALASGNVLWALRVGGHGFLPRGVW